MSEIFRKYAEVRNQQMQKRRQDKMACNYKDNYYGDRACIPCQR